MMNLQFLPTFPDVKSYIQDMQEKRPEYYEEINSVAQSLGQFSPSRKLIVCILIHTSEKNVLKALSLYTSQTLDKDLFEIFIFLNRKKNDPDFEPIESQISEFRMNHPVNISYFKKTLEDKITFGYLRKYLDDIVLLRSTDPKLIHLTNDIDIEDLDPNYLKETYELYSADHFIITYRISDIPDWCKEHPIFYKLVSLYKLADIYSNKLEDIRIPMRMTENFSFTSDLYAQNGGFDDRVSIAEDLVFALIACRNFSKKIFRMVNAKYVASVRRYIGAYIDDRSFFYAWNDFWTSDIRNYNKNELIEKLTEKEKKLDFNYFLKETELFFNYFYFERVGRYLLDYAHPEKPLSIDAMEISTKIFSQVLSQMGYSFRVKDEIDGVYKIELTQKNS